MNYIKQILRVALLWVAVPTCVLAQDTEIWFSLADNPNRESNGVYSFPASDPSAVTAKKTSPELYFSKGMGYQNGSIYGMDYKQGFFSADRYILYAIDTKTWNVTQRDVDKKFSIKEAACGMDGTVYALFEDGGLGTIDYENLVRTDISRPGRSYVALGVSSVGELYGVDDEANLVRISTDNGTETIVGNTGISLQRYSKCTGEIDPVTNLFYLAAPTGWSEAPTIYTIDLTTCEASTVGKLPSSYDYLTGMVILGEAAASGSPAKATNLKATFEGNSLSGVLSFTAPTETFDHKPLEGELAYTVVYGTDGQQTLTGTAQPGQQVEQPITLSEGGNITFAVKFANAAGEGQTATTTLWVGPDAPFAPANVALNISADGLATLSWNAPTACVNGGYLGRLTYNVWRNISGEETLVAEAISETTFSEQLTITTLQDYCYTVVAINEGTLSEPATSNKIVAGDGFGVPFVEQFGEGNRLEYFTVVNVNGDSDRWGELTWKLHTQMTYWGAGDNYEEMIVETSGATDDWLITPPIQMQPGQAYVLKFKMRADSGNMPEKFRVTMGRTATVSGQSSELIAEQAITNTDYKTFQKEFTVAEAGSYCIGFHAVPNRGVALYLDDLEVRVNASPAAPAKAENLVAEPDATGALKATISFTAPTRTIAGDELSELTKIEVLRDEQLIATIDAPQVGFAQSVSDNAPANGYHVYTIIAYNAEGNGLRAETAPVYVGVDVPQSPVVALIADRETSVHIEWAEASTIGQHGFVVRPVDVVYEVYATDATGKKADKVYEGKERAIDVDYTNTDEFDLVKWLIVAKNVAGSSPESAAKMATGYPLTLPYRESFAMGELKLSIWTEQSGVRSWNPSTEDAVGTDAGSLLFAPYSDGDRSSFNTQRLTFVGVRQPELSFWYKGQGGIITLKSWQPDGLETVFATLASSEQWQRCAIDLTQLKPQPYIVLKFEGVGSAGEHLFIDDVLIHDAAFANGIDTVGIPGTTAAHTVYDLQGRRLSSGAAPFGGSELQKGLYIVNGKKIIKGGFY